MKWFQIKLLLLGLFAALLAPILVAEVPSTLVYGGGGYYPTISPLDSARTIIVASGSGVTTEVQFLPSGVSVTVSSNPDGSIKKVNVPIPQGTNKVKVTVRQGGRLCGSKCGAPGQAITIRCGKRR
jgi:hypothetical protein